MRQLDCFSPALLRLSAAVLAGGISLAAVARLLRRAEGRIDALAPVCSLYVLNGILRAKLGLVACTVWGASLMRAFAVRSLAVCVIWLCCVRCVMIFSAFVGRRF